MHGTACDRAQGIPTDLSRWLISLIITKLNRRVAGNSCSHRNHAPFPLPTPFIAPTPRSTHRSYYSQNQIPKPMFVFVMLCCTTEQGYYLLLVLGSRMKHQRQLPQATCGTSMRSIIIFHVGTAFLFVKRTRGLRESGVHQRSLGIIM